MKRIILGISLGGLVFVGCSDDPSPSSGSATTSGSTGDTGGMGGRGGMGSTGTTGGMGGIGGMGSTGSTGGMGSTGGTGGASSSSSASSSSGTGGAPGCVVDGVVTPSEQCDDGNAIDGDGCNQDCTFSCIKGPDSCPDAEACNGVEVCTTIMSGASTGQKCMTGVQLLDCSACASGVCGSGVCKASSCGDGCVDPSKGEQCEPPGTVLCNAMCKTAAAATCGDGTRQAGEQCDDGNTVNLDGCDASCKFEQDLRTNYLEMQFGADAFCGNANKLGAAIPNAVAQGQVQGNITQGIAAGSTGVVVKMLGLDSLVGADDPMVGVGVVRALPVAGVGYTGASDLEWWYTVNPATINATRSPLDTLPGSILGNTLSAGPGAMSLAINFFPSNATVLRLSSAKLQVLVGSSSAPGSSFGGMTPGHLVTEHLDPALQSFSTLGQANANFAGKLCGDISARSLSQAPVPTELLSGGTLPCTEGYSAASSFLDVIVSGCTINLGIPVPAILPSQPDKADPAAPVGGTGAPYKLIANLQKSTNACTDKNNAVVSLGLCLDAAAYSSFFRFAMDRVILK